MAVGTAALPYCRRRLRERIQSEQQSVRGLLKKAEALVVARRKDVDGGAACALPRRGNKSGRFLRPEAAITVTDGAASAKRRKTSVTSPIVEVEVIEPTMPKAQREHLYGLLLSLSAEMPLPPHIVGFMQSQCCCVVDHNGDEMEVDLASTKDATLFQLLNLLEEFAQHYKIQRQEEQQEPPKIEPLDASDAISRSSICKYEEGEIADEVAGMDIDICGGVAPLVVDDVHFSPLSKQEEDGELIDISGGVCPLPLPAKQEDDEFSGDPSPVAVDKFPQTSPTSSSSSSGSSCSGSSSSSSSGASSGSSSSSARSGSSGSSCSDSSSSSSGSDSDTSDDDEDSASSRADTPGLPTEAAAKPLEQQQEVTEHNMKLKLAERAASPMATEMQEATDRDTRAEAKPLEQQRVTEQDKKLTTERAASPATEMQELIARGQEKQKLRRVLDRKRAREELEEMKRTARPVYDIIDPSDMKRLGISREAEYMVSPVKSRDSVRRRGGGLLQKLGFFLKAE